jgi:hypothetical protein
VTLLELMLLWPDQFTAEESKILLALDSSSSSNQATLEEEFGHEVAGLIVMMDCQSQAKTEFI